MHTSVTGSVFGDRLRERRRARGWTQDQTAEALGLSVEMIKAMEAGRRRPGKRTRQVLREVFDISEDEGGEGVGAPPERLSLDDLGGFLRAGWALFYGGQGQVAQESTQTCLRALGGLSGERALAVRGQFHQLAGVILRDGANKAESLTHGAAAVQIARQLDRVDDLASALFRLARSSQQLDLHAQAIQLVREAHALAPRCRQPLAGWLHLARVEVEARARTRDRTSLHDLRPLIDAAHRDLANRLGQDESFTALNTPGIWHVDVLATMYLGGQPEAALSRIHGALNELHRITPNAHRWRAGMQATEALCYARLGDAQAAADLAQTVLHVSTAGSHRRYLVSALSVLAAGDPQGRNAHVARLRRLLAA